MLYLRPTIDGPMCHKMDGDVCSCLPVQLAELVPRLRAFVSNVQRLELSYLGTVTLQQRS
eukprot:COSAG06_NODE_11894_length_1450_cov_11.845707_2_plen_60_part_00